MSFWNFIKNEVDGEDVELRIEGDIVMEEDFWSWLFDIETTTPKGFREQLAEHKGKNITVWINSYGGDVFAASQIYTALKEHKGKVTVKVDGVAISAASVVAMAGDEIFMTPTGLVMIHNPFPGNGIRGEAKDLRHAADVLDEVKETILNAYQLKTKKSRDEISKMMDEETWMSAKKALSEGFVDGILYAGVEDLGSAPIENSFMFSWMSIQNSSSESMRKFIEQYNLKMSEAKLEPVDALTQEPITEPVNDLLPLVTAIQDAGKTLSSANEQKITDARDLLNDVLSQVDKQSEDSKEPENNEQNAKSELLFLLQNQVKINKNRRNLN